MSISRPVAALAAFCLLALPVGAETAASVRMELVVTGQGGSHIFQVELADDPRERATGLMYRRSMPEDEGMLFDFEEERGVSMWMANTYVPLDMLFIKADGSIESIARRTTPLSQRSVASRGPVRYVLEINAGLSDQLGIEAGDMLSGAAFEAVQ